MRDAAAQHHRVQHALALHIVDELAGAGDEAQILRPIHRLTDQRRRSQSSCRVLYVKIAGLDERQSLHSALCARPATTEGSAMKIVDMSHVMNVHTPGWVGYAGNKMYYAQNLQTAMIVAQRIDTALHVGTHFDGAMHATDNRKGDMASLPLDYLVNRGVVVDISKQDGGLGGDHAGDHRERRRRHPRGRHPHPAYRLAQALRRPAAAGSGEILLLPPRARASTRCTGCSRRRSSGGAWTPAPATTP